MNHRSYKYKLSLVFLVSGKLLDAKLTNETQPCQLFRRIKLGLVPGREPVLPATHALVTVLSSEAYAPGLSALHSSLKHILTPYLPHVIVVDLDAPPFSILMRIIRPLEYYVVGLSTVAPFLSAVGLECASGKRIQQIKSIMAVTAAQKRKATYSKLFAWGIGRYVRRGALYVDADALFMRATTRQDVVTLVASCAKGSISAVYGRGLVDKPRQAPKDPYYFNSGVFAYHPSRKTLAQLVSRLVAGKYAPDRSNPTEQDVLVSHWRENKHAVIPLGPEFNVRPYFNGLTMPKDTKIVHWIGFPKPWEVIQAAEGHKIEPNAIANYIKRHNLKSACLRCLPLWSLELYIDSSGPNLSA